MPERRNIPPEVARARARLAGLTAREADPEVIARARLSLDAASARAAVQKWQHLPVGDRAQLPALILAGDGDAA